MINQILNIDCRAGLKELPTASVDCCVTSPPYWGLRDYGVRGQLGLEKTPKKYIAHILEVFREVKRVLKPEGTLWLNMGDSYAHNGAAYGNKKSTLIGRRQGQEMGAAKRFVKKGNGLKPKDLVGIPWMVAFALRADGWFLRQDIIWNKPNPMPESVTDRCTKAHEYIFLLSKSRKYYYDAKSIATPYRDKTYTTFGCESKGNGDGSGLIKSENWNNTVSIRKPKQWKTPDGWDTGKGSHGSIHKSGREDGFKGYEHRGKGDKKLTRHSGYFDKDGNLIGGGNANKKSVWTVTARPFSEAHFATFPPELIVDCIKAGCPENGTVLDPFMGAGTTAMVARKLNRNYIGFELNARYIQIAEKRLHEELGLFR